MPRGDGVARGADIGAVGELQAFALPPDALAEDCKVEDLDTHGARSLTAHEGRV